MTSTAPTTAPTPIYPLQRTIARLVDVDIVDCLYTPISHLEDDDEKVWQLRLFCTPLLHAVKHETGHLEKLDDQLALLLAPAAVPRRAHDRGRAGGAAALAGPDLVHRVGDLLARLPRTPQRKLTLPLNSGRLRVPGKTLWDGVKSGRWANRYIPADRQDLFKRSAPSDLDDADTTMSYLTATQDRAWEHMSVTTHIDTNSVVLAVAIARAGGHADPALADAMTKYVDLLSSLIDEYDALCDAAKFGHTVIVSDASSEVQELKAALFVSSDPEGDHVQALAVLKVFLWTAWQRSVMLYFHYVIGVQLFCGYSSAWNSRLAVRGIYELMALRREDYRGDEIPYLCNWAFELLRTGRSSVALDFRGLLSRFDAHFRGLEARCVKGSAGPCDGAQPESCERFTAAEDRSQSAHSHTCKGLCEKVVWSRSSYVGCPLPRATVADVSCETLRYRPLGDYTLAISHVWSHGQGGRPETGLNRCLHERYCRLAKLFACEAYWIDTTCIPSEDPMRTEAIRNINKIFAGAKVTLVIDTDIQSVDVSLPSIATYETLLSIFLVCDWNVRAWTLLEAVRGSRSIYLLCKDEAVVSLREILLTVHGKGAIDIAVLLGSAQHLVPHQDPTSAKTIEEASHLLSQRHCSWPSDEVICWSLLNNGSGSRDPDALWRSQSVVRTGYLMSTPPRVQSVFGLGWAPECPYIRPHLRSVQLPYGEMQSYSLRVPSYDGEGSLVGRITDSGLVSRWQVMDMSSTVLEGYREHCLSMMDNLAALFEQDPHAELDDPRIREVFAHPDEAKLFMDMEELLDAGARVRLIRPLAADGIAPYQGNAQRGEDFGLVAAMCGSYDDGVTWTWKAVYQWQEPDNYDQWRVQDMVIV